MGAFLLGVVKTAPCFRTPFCMAGSVRRLRNRQRFGLRILRRCEAATRASRRRIADNVSVLGTCRDQRVTRGDPSRPSLRGGGGRCAVVWVLDGLTVGRGGVCHQLSAPRRAARPEAQAEREACSVEHHPTGDFSLVLHDLILPQRVPALHREHAGAMYLFRRSRRRTATRRRPERRRR